MRFRRSVPSFVAAAALAVAVGACAPDGPYDGQGIEGKGGASGAAGNQGGAGGPAGSGGGNVGPGGSAGSVTGSGGSTGVAGTSGRGGTTGSGGSTGAGGGSGSAGADGTAGASGSTGTGGAGQAGRGGTGAGGAVSGRGGGAGGAGLGGRGGASGAAGSGAAGSGAAGSGAAGSGAAGSGGSGATMRSPGCGKTPTLTSGNRTIQSGGQSRSYILRIPSNYDNNRPYRLIFGYHWRGGTMQDVDGGGSSGATWSYYGLRAQADNSAIFVAPQGIGNGWDNSGGRDLTFTDDMVALIEGDLCVDTKQVYALGFSYGGGMSYALACARPSVFRAVAVYSGADLSGCQGGTQPVAYIGIHGLGDVTLNISLGRSLRDRFVMNNGCTAQNPPEPRAGSLTHTCTTYQGCRAGFPVEWCAFDGGHTPGVVDGGGDDGARTWTKTEVWKFFSQFQ
jgi:poly(3-hydroxybutyrate) depolymerase